MKQLNNLSLDSFWREALIFMQASNTARSAFLLRLPAWQRANYRWWERQNLKYLLAPLHK